MIRFAFYKANNRIWDKFISYWTLFWNLFRVIKAKIKYKTVSHVEIGMIRDNVWMYVSSCSRYYTQDNKKSNGVRWIKGKDLFNHPERWCVIELEPIRPIKDMTSDANKHLGEPYDWFGIAGFGTIFGLINDPDAWYCSEFCNYVFTGEWTKRISPLRLCIFIITNFKFREVPVEEYAFA